VERNRGLRLTIHCTPISPSLPRSASSKTCVTQSLWCTFRENRTKTGCLCTTHYNSCRPISSESTTPCPTCILHSWIQQRANSSSNEVSISWKTPGLRINPPPSNRATKKACRCGGPWSANRAYEVCGLHSSHFVPRQAEQASRESVNAVAQSFFVR
jgi:hypothetical protein